MATRTTTTTRVRRREPGVVACTPAALEMAAPNVVRRARGDSRPLTTTRTTTSDQQRPERCLHPRAPDPTISVVRNHPAATNATRHSNHVAHLRHHIGRLGR